MTRPRITKDAICESCGQKYRIPNSIPLERYSCHCGGRLRLNGMMTNVSLTKEQSDYLTIHLNIDLRDCHCIPKEHASMLNDLFRKLTKHDHEAYTRGIFYTPGETVIQAHHKMTRNK